MSKLVYKVKWPRFHFNEFTIQAFDILSNHYKIDLFTNFIGLWHADRYN